MRMLKVSPMETPTTVELEEGNLLQSVYEAIGCGCDCIQGIYPFDDPVTIICDDEGKFRGTQMPNRCLFDENGEMYDQIFGTFLIAGLGDENWRSLTDAEVEKYTERFKCKEMTLRTGNYIHIFFPDTSRPTISFKI